MTVRNQTIDIAKGIAIILMVIGHCYHQENGILMAIYAFHMPFFFLVSGMLYAGKWQEHIDFHPLVTCRRMLVPYIVFDTLFCLFVTMLGRPDDMIGQFFRSVVRQILPLQGTTVTWYLPCQLMVLCMFALGAKYLKKPVWIAVCAAMYIIAQTSPPHGLLPLWRSLTGVGFFAAGFYGKPLLTRKYSLSFLLVLGAVYFWLVRLNGMVSLVSLEYSNPVLYTVNGLLGSWLLYQICLHFPRGKWFSAVEFLGKNTVIVLCTHMFFVEVIRLLDYKLFDNVLYTFGIWEGFVFGAMVVGLMFPVIAVCNRYFGKLFGK